jgi:hypothetical protein
LVQISAAGFRKNGGGTRRQAHILKLRAGCSLAVQLAAVASAAACAAAAVSAAFATALAAFATAFAAFAALYWFIGFELVTDQ